MTRKNAIIILVLVVVISVLYILYSLFFGSQSNTPETEQNKRVFGSFFPINKEETQENTDQNNVTFPTRENNADSKNIPKLRKITSVPTSGAIIFNRTATTSEFINEEEKISTTTETVIRYVERSTGHIYETLTTNLTTKRISNTSLPKNTLAQFDDSGENILFKIDSNQNSFFNGKIKKAEEGEEVGRVTGSFLPNNTIDADLFSNSLFYSNMSPDEKYGEIFNLYYSNNNAETKNIFKSVLSEWLIEPVNNELISLLTKPSYSASGYYYELNLKTGKQTKYLDEVLGLNAKANSKYILYSSYSNDSLKNLVHNKETGEEKTIEINTLPKEKCVFSKTDENIAYCASALSTETKNMPDSWYLGLISTTDFLYKIDLEKGTTKFLGFQDVEKGLDVYNIYISPDEKFLMFINKKDLSLWSLEI